VVAGFTIELRLISKYPDFLKDWPPHIFSPTEFCCRELLCYKVTICKTSRPASKQRSERTQQRLKDTPEIWGVPGRVTGVGVKMQDTPMQPWNRNLADQHRDLRFRFFSRYLTQTLHAL